MVLHFQYLSWSYISAFLPFACVFRSCRQNAKSYISSIFLGHTDHISPVSVGQAVKMQSLPFRLSFWVTQYLVVSKQCKWPECEKLTALNLTEPVPQFTPPSVITTFSRAGSPCKCAAMFCLGWMSLAVLHWVASRVLARLFWTEVSPIQPEDSSIPLFKATVSSRSWVRKLVNSGLELWLVIRYKQLKHSFVIVLFKSTTTTLPPTPLPSCPLGTPAAKKST